MPENKMDHQERQRIKPPSAAAPTTALSITGADLPRKYFGAKATNNGVGTWQRLMAPKQGAINVSLCSIENTSDTKVLHVK